MRRLLTGAVVLGLVLVLLSTGGGFGAFLGWAAFGYLLIRAWPGVVADVRSLVNMGSGLVESRRLRGGGSL